MGQVGQRVRRVLGVAIVALCMALGVPTTSWGEGPPASQSVTAAPLSNGLAVHVSWTAVEDAVTYRVFRSPSELNAADDAYLVAETTATTYLDVLSPQGESWHYAVQVVDAEDQVSPLTGSAQTAVGDGSELLRTQSTTWLRGQQEAAQGFKVRFARDYDADYIGKVSGSVDDVPELEGERVQIPWIGFDDRYSSAYVGPVRGTWEAIERPQDFEVKVYSVTDDAYLQGTYRLDADGTWSSGDDIARGGEKLAVVVAKDDGAELTRTGRARSAVSGMVVRIYSRTDVDYLQDEVPVFDDGTWISTKTIHAGTKVARLVNTYTGRVYNSTEWSQQTPFQGLVRSFYIPQDDPSYGYQGDASRRTGYRLEQRSWLYDDAIAAIAFTYAGERERARAVLARLAELQRADGSFDFSYDTFIGSVFDRYERSGASAWAGYAATEYQRITGDTSFETMARRTADRLLQLQVSTTNGFDENDPRYGSILGGTGRYDNNYDYIAEPISWASTEHNIDAYFFLRDLGYLTHAGRYSGAAALIKQSLVEHHWNEGLRRFNQGVGTDGPDTARALDLASWGGMFLLAIGDEDRAADAASELANFRVEGAAVTTSTDPDSYNTRYQSPGPISGYKPYIDGGGYSGAPNVVWTEGTWGALLFQLRRGEDVSSDLDSLRRLQLADPKRGLLQVTRGAAQLPYEFHAWPAVGATAWSNLVTEDAGALWQPDGWNRSTTSNQLTDKTYFIITSAADPSTYYWRPTLAPGIHLAVAGNGNLVARDSEGHYLDTVAFKFALDSNNEQVPMSYAWDGDTVTITVDHAASPNTMYPVLVDTNVEASSVDLLEEQITTLARISQNVDYEDMNAQERAFCKPLNRKGICLAFSNDANKARRTSVHLFDGQADGSKQNAYKHAYWTALMENSAWVRHGKRRYLDLALTFAVAHEGKAFKSPDDAVRLNSLMDVQNDASGYFQMQERIVDGISDYYLCGRVRDLVHGGRYSRDRYDWQSGEVIWINHKYDEIATPDCSPAR